MSKVNYLVEAREPADIAQAARGLSITVDPSPRNADGLTEEFADTLKVLAGLIADDECREAGEFNWLKRVDAQMNKLRGLSPHTFAPKAATGRLSEEEMSALAMGNRLLDMSGQKDHAAALEAIAIKYGPETLGDELTPGRVQDVGGQSADIIRAGRPTYGK